MQQKGQVTLVCDRKGRLQTIDFLVVDVPGDKPPLLSEKDAQALEYLKIMQKKQMQLRMRFCKLHKHFPHSEC